MSSDTGKTLLWIGLAIMIVGAVIYFFHDKLGWFGRLPGDIAVEKESFRFYFPITTLIVINIVIWIALKLFRRN